MVLGLRVNRAPTFQPQLVSPADRVALVVASAGETTAASRLYSTSMRWMLMPAPIDTRSVARRAMLGLML